MNIREYFIQDTITSRKVITEDISRATRFLNDFERKNNVAVSGISFVSLKTVAKEIVYFNWAKDGFNSIKSIISNDEAAVILKNLILDNIEKLDYFNEESVLNLETVKEIYSKISLIRQNGWNGKENNANDRVKDLKTIISLYQSKLKEKGLLDDTEMLFEAVNTLKACNSQFGPLYYLFSCEFSVVKEDMETLSGIEKELVSILVKESGGSVLEISCRDTNSNDIEFFTAFGGYNEANYVVNDILKKGIPFGDAAVFYTSSSQLPAISYAFEGNGIKTRFLSEKSIQKNPYVSLIKRILEWATDDYSEYCLERIFGSTVLYAKYDEDGTETNLLKGSSYFNHILKKTNKDYKLGWGIDRNIALIDEEYKTASEKEKVVLDIHRALIQIFVIDNNIISEKYLAEPQKIVNNIYSFIKEYTVKSAEKSIALKKLGELTKVVVCEEKELSLRENLSFLKGLVDRLSLSDEEASDAISVIKLNSWQYTGRKHVYFIGLTLNQMKIKGVQSSVLFDDELELFLGEGYKPTIDNLTKLRNRNLDITISLLEDTNVSFGYSNYDTVAFCENGPSSYFREKLKASGKEISEITEFVYGNPNCVIERNEAPEKIPMDEYGVVLNTSNTTLEKFVECPKKYAFEKILYLPDNDYTSFDSKIWLDQMAFGLLFHKIAERYTKSVFIKKHTEPYPYVLEKNTLSEIISEEKKYWENNLPISTVAAHNTDVNRITSMCTSYFSQCHEELCGEEAGWRYLVVEQRFEGSNLEIKDYNGKVWEFSFSGYIDCIQYKIINEKKEILIRAIDYKTGRRKAKEDDYAKGKVIQHIIYRNAILNILKDDILREIIALESESIKDYEIIFDSFIFIFPKENENNRRFVISNYDIVSDEISRLKAGLASLSTLEKYPNKAELSNVMENISLTGTSTDEHFASVLDSLKKGELCTYCSYQDLCDYNKGGKQ